MVSFMVYHVHGPKHPKLVVHAVQPVEAKVPKKEGQCELRHMGPLCHQPQAEPLIDGVEHGHFKAPKHPKNGVPGIQVEHDLVPGHFFALNEAQDERLNGHHQEQQCGWKYESHTLKMRKITQRAILSRH